MLTHQFLDELTPDSHFAAILEPLAQGVCALDAYSRIIFANRRAREILGFADAFPVEPIRERSFRLEQDAPMCQAIATVLADGTEAHFQYRSETLERWLDVHLVPAATGVLVYLDDITANREQESAREWLAAIFASSNDPIIGLAPDRKIANWNRAAQNVFGYTAAEIVGQPISILVPPELIAEHRGLFEKLLRGEAVVNHGTSRKHKNGGLLDVTISVSVVRSTGNEIIGYVAIVRDITARKRALELVYESYQRNNEILETINDAYISIDAKWCFTYVNLKAQKLAGKSREELLGKNIWEMFPYAAASPLKRYLEDARRDQRQVEFEMFSDIDGHWYEVSAYPYRRGLIVYLRDIDARKAAEEAQRASQELYRTLFESMDQGFCIIEMMYDEQKNPVDFRVLETNHMFETLTGLTDALGKTATELVSMLEPLLLESYGNVARKGEPVRFIKFSQTNGRWFDVYASRLGGPASNKLALLFTDITQRKRAEEDLVRARDELEMHVQERTLQLEELGAVRQQLLQKLVTAQELERSRITRELHDQLGQLLTAISLGLSALRARDRTEDSFEEQLEKLQQLTRQTDQTVQSVVHQLRPPALDALGLVTTLENYLEEWSTLHEISVQLEITGSRASRLAPDVETTIYRIVQEALTNVVRHAYARNVNVTLDLGHDRVVTVVEDDGYGYDTDRVAAERHKSHSMGLESMRERAEMVGGTLEIESQLQVGTTIFIRIPVYSVETKL